MESLQIRLGNAILCKLAVDGLDDAFVDDEERVLVWNIDDIFYESSLIGLFCLVGIRISFRIAVCGIDGTRVLAEFGSLRSLLG